MQEDEKDDNRLRRRQLICVLDRCQLKTMSTLFCWILDLQKDDDWKATTTDLYMNLGWKKRCLKKFNDNSNLCATKGVSNKRTTLLGGRKNLAANDCYDLWNVAGVRHVEVVRRRGWVMKWWWQLSCGSGVPRHVTRTRWQTNTTDTTTRHRQRWRRRTGPISIY